MAYLSGITTSFLVAFPALFSIVNPFGGALIYSQITLGRRSMGISTTVLSGWRWT